ncbi:MAG: ion transporter [Phycisphaerales bacterium JB063]
MDQTPEQPAAKPSEPVPIAASSPSNWRERTHEIIFEADTWWGKTFDVVLILAILASVVVIMLETVEPIRAEHGTLLIVLEWAFTVLFTAEYVLRLISVRRPLRYAFSFFGIIDLLSILPTYIGLFVPGAHELMVIRMFRLLRVFRVFKLVRFLGEADALKHAVLSSRHKIAVFLTTVLIIITIMGAMMHVVESRYGNPQFTSLPQSMYWAVVTMTTVGYGDITPITTLGKFLSAAMMIIGYSLIIIPTGIITAEMTHSRRRVLISTQHCPHCSRDGHDRDAVHCKYCGGTL